MSLWTWWSGRGRGWHFPGSNSITDEPTIFFPLTFGSEPCLVSPSWNHFAHCHPLSNHFLLGECFGWNTDLSNQWPSQGDFLGILQSQDLQSGPHKPLWWGVQATLPQILSLSSTATEPKSVIFLHSPWTTVFQGENVTLTCKAFHLDASEKIKWYRWYLLEKTQSETSGNTHEVHESGDYRCQAQDSPLSNRVGLLFSPGGKEMKEQSLEIIKLPRTQLDLLIQKL